MSQSLLSQVVSLAVLEQEIARLLAEAFVKEFDRIIIHGSGTGQPLGILNDARIRVGFDETSEASKYLISGVWGHKEGDDDRGPVNAKGKKIARMKPDKKLQDIFWKKRYMQKRTKEMEIFFQNELARLTREALD